MKEIVFDLDGTLVDFYNVDNWLECLINNDTKPYEIAKPLCDMNALARILNKLQKNGYILTIVSWGSKNASDKFLHEIKLAKEKWLNKHLHSVHFDNINVIPYGTNKQLFASENSILFDDEIGNRDNWHGVSYDETHIVEILKSL